MRNAFHIKESLTRGIKVGLFAGALATVALFLPSCANKRFLNYGTTSGFGQCNGPLVNADVYLQPGPDANTYRLTIIPVSVPSPGDVATVTIANSSLSYKELVHQTVLVANQQINAGYVTAAELQTYNILAITPFNPTTDFFSGNSNDDTLCYVPQPGDDGSQSVGGGSTTPH